MNVSHPGEIFVTRAGEIEAERVLVGAALLDESVVDTTALASDCFANSDLRRTWRAMAVMRGEGKPLDALLVAKRAEVAPSLLSRCAMETLTADNAEYYAEVVHEHALTRVVPDRRGRARRGPSPPRHRRQRATRRRTQSLHRYRRRPAALRPHHRRGRARTNAPALRNLRGHEAR